ncbi:hypothetical protein GCM10022236_42260 [Microlunatus ginsengisoli]|uniref:Uncharacterized protein n=1 Tax=Microlunatus ginsengisoli TaxID=363863 RepID=A0ABP7ALF7_9ACTN
MAERSTDRAVAGIAQGSAQMVEVADQADAVSARHTLLYVGRSEKASAPAPGAPRPAGSEADTTARAGCPAHDHNRVPVRRRTPIRRM